MIFHEILRKIFCFNTKISSIRKFQRYFSVLFSLLKGGNRDCSEVSLSFQSIVSCYLTVRYLTVCNNLQYRKNSVPTQPKIQYLLRGIFITNNIYIYIIYFYIISPSPGCLQVATHFKFYAGIRHPSDEKVFRKVNYLYIQSSLKFHSLTSYHIPIISG